MSSSESTIGARVPDRRPDRGGVLHQARVFAEIHTPALVVEEGAVIQGPVETGPPPGAEGAGPKGL